MGDDFAVARASPGASPSPHAGLHAPCPRERPVLPSRHRGGNWGSLQHVRSSLILVDARFLPLPLPRRRSYWQSDTHPASKSFSLEKMGEGGKGRKCRGRRRRGVRFCVCVCWGGNNNCFLFPSFKYVEGSPGEPYEGARRRKKLLCVFVCVCVFPLFSRSSWNLRSGSFSASLEGRPCD